MFSAIMSSLFFSFLLHSFFSIWDLIPYKIVLQVLVALFFFPVVFFFFPIFISVCIISVNLSLSSLVLFSLLLCPSPDKLIKKILSLYYLIFVSSIYPGSFFI